MLTNRRGTTDPKRRLELDVTIRTRDFAAVDSARPGCTCRGTRVCPTAYYHCGTGPFTTYSCDYTVNHCCTA